MKILLVSTRKVQKQLIINMFPFKDAETSWKMQRKLEIIEIKKKVKLLKEEIEKNRIISEKNKYCGLKKYFIF